MLSQAILNRVVTAIKGQAELNGCMIGFHGNGASSILDNGMMPTINWTEKIVLVEQSVVSLSDEDLVNPRIVGQDSPPDPVFVKTPNFIPNRSRLASEGVGTALSCGFAIISLVGVVGGAVGELPSGGTSTVLVIAGWAGLASSGMQCINGLVRTSTAIANPGDNTLQRWDDNEVYSGLSLLVDGIGIVSGAVTLKASVGSLRILLVKRSLLASEEAMKNMNRAERTIAMAKAITKAAETEEGRVLVVKAMKDVGMNDAQIAAALKKGVGGIDKGNVIMAALSKPTAEGLSRELRSILITGGNFGASAAPAALTGSASGFVNFVIVHTLQRPVAP
jgi:hypothetical protein